ncbi:MAG TPA: hypothetical protein VLJ68_14120 [Chitinophagaceae bacterium]|nr:hypothetical protein [Chitinophagaceae bacterium]
MDKKTLTILLGTALIAGFFLPFFKGGGSGFDAVFGPLAAKSAEKYIWLLIPISGIVLLLGAINRGNYFMGRGLWAWLPLMTLIFIVVRIFMTTKPQMVDLFKAFGAGFWICLVAALVLAFADPKR